MRVVLFISHSAMILLHIAEIVFCCLAVVLLLCSICDSCFAVIPFQVMNCFAVALFHVIAVITVVSVMTVSAVILFHVFSCYIWYAVIAVILFHE